MVKADLTRDYYGDLELPQTADISEIKKQFKKLALAYHPDRNPGRESEVTAKFQMIQSAHEVLIDPQERAKYDSNRIRSGQRYQSGGNQRGNPWSNVSSQYPTPPKAPTARTRPTPSGPPPPSAGAQRYKNFETPKQSANQSAQEGAEARRSTYAAWENMRNSSGPKPPPSWKPPPPNQSRPPPTNFPSGTGENRRAQSSSGQNRHSFKPDTPGGDEPAAPRGQYFTQRNKSAQAPEPPPRGPAPPSFASEPSPNVDPSRQSREQRPPPPSFASQPSPSVDPLKQFREQAGVPYEPRLSTPYATHGGEKLNPFDSANMNRSKSTREPRDRTETSKNMPRAGSDSNLNSPQRTKSFAQSSRHPRPSYTVPTADSDSSSETGPEIKPRPRAQPYEARRFAKARGSTTQSPNLNHETFSQSQPASATMPKTTNGNHTQPPSMGTTQPSQPTPQTNGDNPSIFNFKVDGTTFQRTESNGFSSSTENINTKFTPEEWEGKFEAGYFQPEQKAANMSHRPRTQSGSRTRGRSPTKTRPTDVPYVQHPHSESEIPAQSPGSLKFSQAEWAGTFKAQSFMPPPPAPAAKVPARPARKRASIIKPTMGTAAVVDDDTDSSLEKPLFTGRKPRTTAPPTPVAEPSPEPMDVDTPPVFKPYTSTSRRPSEGLNVNTTSPKRPAAPSQSASPTDQESLKVNFEDLKIKDIISSMNLPLPPIAPQVPQTPTEAEYKVYMDLLADYMKDWDLFYSRIMLHLLARKNQNVTLDDKRWNDTAGLETYRMGLREDKVVLAHWSSAQESHANVMKAHTIIRERMKEKDTRPPRKKNY